MFFTLKVDENGKSPRTFNVETEREGEEASCWTMKVKRNRKEVMNQKQTPGVTSS